MNDTVTPADFERKYGLRLERLHMRARAIKILKDCGPHLSWKIDKLFENALEHNKVSKVVNAFEEAWEEHISQISNIIDQGVAIMLLVDNIYARFFMDVIERQLGVRPHLI